jgi:hypothetical protein
MFQLVARINETVNLQYNRKFHTWQNVRLFPNTPVNEICISKEEEKDEAIGMIGVLAFFSPARIEYVEICLN